MQFLGAVYGKTVAGLPERLYFLNKAMPKIFRVSGDFTEKFRVGRSGKTLFYSKKFWLLECSTKVVTKRVELV